MLNSRYTYGTGHDFASGVPLEAAESYSGGSRRGMQKWGAVDLIWFTVYPAAFNNEGFNRNAVSDSDYSWLESVLRKTDNAILLFHVPVRTPKTKHEGRWPSDLNLSIPLTDPLYSIIKKHKESIVTIFNGHIHTQIKDVLYDIPVYICPFFDSGCHCEVNQIDNEINITPKYCGIEKSSITLNNTRKRIGSMMATINLLLSD